MKSIIVFILCFGAVLINDATGIRLQSGYLKPWHKFHNEARDGHQKKIKELLNNGVYVDVFDSDNETALFKAAENNRRSVVELLLSKHANIHWKNKNGSSPLHAAAFNGHERVVEILIEHGADVNTIEKYGWTSLHVAANRGHVQIVELLLRKKAAVNLQTITGETPLFNAAMAGNDYIVEKLIQHGADINIQDQNGWSPLHTATSKGHKKTMRILLKNGANANLKNKKNDTPLDIAIRLGRPRIIEILNLYNDTSTVPPIKTTSFTTITPTDDSIRPAKKECKSQAVRVSDETKSRQRLDFSEKFPWMAALGYANIDQNSVNFYCGATIISERFVLTAAYCVSWKHPTVVRIGMESATHGEFMTTNFTIKEVIVHPEYSSETKVNDIALIEIAGEVPLTHSISPACLHLDANDLPSNVPLTLTTWGARSPYSNDGSKSLRKIEVVSVPLSNCSIKVKNLNRNDLTYGQYCTYDPLESSDGCKGDGGAALQYFSNNSRTATVVGIASFGFACNLKLPAIYTRVAYYLDWIESHVWPTSAPLPSTPITTPPTVFTPTPSTPGACSADEWQCDNGKCINAEFKCDGLLDCIDNSDETKKNCPLESEVQATNTSSHSPVVWNELHKAAHLACTNYSNLPMQIPQRTEFTPRIYGGVLAKRGEFPWMAALGYINFNPGGITYDCGGTIISAYFVLTAGHCATPNRSPILVKLGKIDLTDDIDTTNYEIQKIVRHPDYSRLKNDIALIRVKNSISFTTEIRPVCLHMPEYDINFEEDLTLPGWGKTESNKKSNYLLKTKLKMMPLSECNETIKLYWREGINERHYCAYDPLGKNDACEGDSGGPLQYFNSDSNITTVVGIVSSGNGCGGLGIYTRVAYYLGWIESIVWPLNEQQSN